MIGIENTEVAFLSRAASAMRNPMDSWYLSDSGTTLYDDFYLGPKDRELFLKLVKGGSEHRKHIRIIDVVADFTLPRYVWTEFDTYKIGTVRLSCSTMHKLGCRELVNSDFAVPPIPEVLIQLNSLGKTYRDSGKADYSLVKTMKALLPEGFLQKATVKLNYEVLVNMFGQRRNHRLDEWKFTGEANTNSICNWIYSLPLMMDILEAAGCLNVKG